MALELVIILLVIVIVWLGIVTFYMRRLMEHYQKLTNGISKKHLDFVLEKLIKDIDHTKNGITNLNSRCDTMEKDAALHIQKIGFLRFNPFKDIGGDQSFILTLADAKNTGVVITGLYSRSGVRWYVKKVVAGRGVEHELSEEEKKALNENS